MSQSQSIRDLRSTLSSAAYLKAYEYYCSREVAFALEVVSIEDLPFGWQVNGALTRYSGKSEDWSVRLRISLNCESVTVIDWSFGSQIAF
jgi:hypothetical protein